MRDPRLIPALMIYGGPLLMGTALGLGLGRGLLQALAVGAVMASGPLVMMLAYGVFWLIGQAFRLLYLLIVFWLQLFRV